MNTNDPGFLVGGVKNGGGGFGVRGVVAEIQEDKREDEVFRAEFERPEVASVMMSMPALVSVQPRRKDYTKHPAQEYVAERSVTINHGALLFFGNSAISRPTAPH